MLKHTKDQWTHLHFFRVTTVHMFAFFIFFYKFSDFYLAPHRSKFILKHDIDSKTQLLQRMVRPTWSADFRLMESVGDTTKRHGGQPDATGEMGKVLL